MNIESRRCSNEINQIDYIFSYLISQYTINSNFNNFGNWNPTIEHGTITDSACQYYKIGKLVTLFCAIWGSGDGTDNTVALSLPFQAISFRAYGSVGYFPGAVNYPNLHVIIANENKLMFEYSGGDDVKHINGK